MITFVEWPRIPTAPPVGEAALVRVSGTDLRTVLREVLAEWGVLSSLRETPRGPVCDLFDISLSYAEDEGWIGLLRGGWIGIDAMRVEMFAEEEAVARHFFEPAAHKAIRDSRTFALAWTEMEARLKCVKRDLVEWSPAREAATRVCASESFVTMDDVAVTVARKLAGMSPVLRREESRGRTAPG